MARDRGFRIPDGSDDLLPQFAAAVEALAVRAAKPVPCHTDPLAANFIDDGSGSG